MCQRLFFMKISKNCDDLNNPFHLACRQWYSYNNPGILT